MSFRFELIPIKRPKHVKNIKVYNYLKFNYFLHNKTNGIKAILNLLLKREKHYYLP
jgi:hypothetical protein